MIKNNTLTRIFVVLICFATFSCAEPLKMDLSEAVLIPKPLKIEATGSSFELNDATKIILSSKELSGLGIYLNNLVSPATGYSLKTTQGNTPEENSIYLGLHKMEPEFGLEGYELTITEEGVSIKAAYENALFRGIQTLRQILPEEIEAATVQQAS